MWSETNLIYSQFSTLHTSKMLLSDISSDDVQNKKKVDINRQLEQTCVFLHQEDIVRYKQQNN
jgi:hypothetical protein